ncbi:uncharacterized protein LOC109715936 isoform X2 [Ananas comosus]|uniref:Uncharacterized protein LOC109715936 isoform X2 n=1 Tax=Ananas comosus TaxID=4615 RepID=A0A6P5FLD4_ANACO|nr:uncharacterized protein LOC109715936 isoform X2 [Ananas comosus]
MKSQRNHARGGDHHSRRIGNMIIIASMLLSLCALSFIKARFCSTPYEYEEIKKIETKSKSENNNNFNIIDEVGEEEEDDDSGEATCHATSRRSDTCDARGDVRVAGRSKTVHVRPLRRAQRIKPYARKHDAVAFRHVSEWALLPFPRGQSPPPPPPPPPACTVNQSVPAFLFSTGGFTGNLFHDYTDVLVPIFISAYQFRGAVQFLVTDVKPWWIHKFEKILKQLTNFDIVDVDADEEVRCFPRLVAGPAFHKELGVNASKTPGGYSVVEFRKMLREAFGLERAAAVPGGDRWDIRRKPRLLIISRKNTRMFLNERAMVEMATSLGFDVRIGEPDVNTDVGQFARLVNSADVMLGVHGAGLTNMVFLPAGAVLIQVVPFGGLEWLTMGTFGNATKDMEINYMEYKIKLDETTLREQYPKNHPVLKNPCSIHKQGWTAIKTAYLDKQNVRPHLGRLKKTLLQALKLLPHSHMH